jgi:ASC-1-like (ASCH) protein
MRVKQASLELIKSEKKTLEVRVGLPAIKAIRVGDHIKMESRSDKAVVRVVDVRIYPAIDVMMAAEDTSRIDPSLTEAEIAQQLKQIYPPDRQKLGMVVLDVKIDK